jgi:hypothetical protein
MGRYFNPTNEVASKGREIYGNSYDELVNQLQEGEYLIGLYDRGIFKNAPHLYSEREYNEFEDQANAGIILREGYYAVSEEIYRLHVR